MSTDWEETTEAVIGSAFIVSNVLGAGFLEKVYENALAHELRKTGRHVEQQRTVDVHYDQQVVGRFVADLVVDHRVLVEMKSARGIDEVHHGAVHQLFESNVAACLPSAELRQAKGAGKENPQSTRARGMGPTKLVGGVGLMRCLFFLSGSFVFICG